MTLTPDPLMYSERPARPLRPVLSSGVVALVASSVAAIVLVGMLAIQAMRASDEKERMADRSLRDYATFGAATFFSRSASQIVGSSGYLLGVIDAALASSKDPNSALRAATLVADSALICDCGPKLVLIEARIINERSGAVLANYQKRDSSAIDGTEVEPLRVLADAGPTLRWRLYGTRSRGVLIAMRRLSANVADNHAIAVIAFDGESVASEIFAPVYRSFPPLLPSALLGATANDSIVAIDVRSTDDQLFAHYGPITARRQESRQRYGGNNTAAVVANLTISSEGALRATTVGDARGKVIILLSVMTLFAVASAMGFAWRSYRLGRLRMDFASSISHELRTPLTEIILYSELIESGRTRRNNSTEDAARTIRGEARRLHQMVENSLHMAQAERRLIRLSPAPESLAELVDELLAIYSPMSARRNVTITHHGDCSVSASVDPDAVRHILLNILDNALRYGPVGQHVEVRTQRVGDSASIIVDDEGPGIPEAERHHVFRPYYRLARDAEHGQTGSGIGLAVVADLVREMNGTVRVDPAPRGGARIVLSFPLVVAEIAASRTQESAPNAADLGTMRPRESA